MRDNAADSVRYEVSCKKGHRFRLDATDLEDLIRSGEHKCSKCKRSLDLEDELDLQCRICSMTHTAASLTEAMYLMEDECGACPMSFGEQSIHVRGSWSEALGEYEWMRNGRDAEPLTRPGRTDYWEGVVHFCTAPEFSSIFAASRIRAATTGYFRTPAVCLTEATYGNWKELQSRHGSFGYVFEKRDVLAAGGGPALYLSPKLIEAQKLAGGFCNKIKPFVNLLRIRSVTPNATKHDFLHEREWRVPKDIDFEKTSPFGVIIDWNVVSRKMKGWRNVFGAAMAYEELNEVTVKRTDGGE